MKRVLVHPLVCVALWLTAAPAASAQPHGGDFWPCITAEGQLALSPAGRDPLEPADSLIVLPAASGLFQGWSSNNPGFDDINTDDPANNAFVFDPGGFIRLEVLALDPALLVWNTAFQQFGPGTSAPLGTTEGELHTHLIWHIRSNAPEFDPARTFWRGTFRLIDTGSTAYAASDEFTLYFSRVACTTADVNADAAVDFFDIDPFLTVLFDLPNATDVQKCAADVNRDGGVDFFDIDPFVTALFGG